MLKHTFRIREIDGADYTADLALLHEEIFETTAPLPLTDEGHWWLAWSETEAAPIGFAGVIPSDRFENAGYYKRVGVLPLYRGGGLQQRFTRVIEARCRRNGWSLVISDTTDNIPSANNFIRSGYRLFMPDHPWALPGSLYWRKAI